MTGKYKNDKIKPEVKTVIQTQNDKLIAAFNEKSTQKITALFSDKLSQKVDNGFYNVINSFFTTVHSPHYSLLDEYYSINSSTGMTGQVMSGVSNENDYSITYPVSNKETYISLLLSQEENKDILVSCFYGKYGEEWKLEMLQFGQYAIFHKNAIDIYKEAQQDYKKGKILDAVINLNLLKKVANPASDYFKYQKYEEMKEFQKQVYTEASKKYPLPLLLSEVKTTPLIYDILPNVTEEGIFPSISYKTKIDISDTTSLKKENDELQQKLGEILPDLSKTKDIYFQAFNELPVDENALVKYYGFIMKSANH